MEAAQSVTPRYPYSYTNVYLCTELNEDLSMKTIHIINGPNLNRIGSREPEIYGSTTFEDYLERLRNAFPACDIVYFQSNHEGDIIDYLQEIGDRSDGIILNAGALAHYSLAIADALRSVSAPVVEVHISNLATRETYRHQTVLTASCLGMIEGFGLDGYRLALAHLVARRPL